MKTYNVIRKSDNKIIYSYSTEGDMPIEWFGMDFSNYNHVEYAVDPAPVVINHIPVKITKLAFRNRFTTVEKVTLELASKDDTAASVEERKAAAMIRVYLDDVNAATYIDLNRPDTRNGVLMLEQFKLIGTGRALTILDTPPTEEEIYNG